MIQIVFKTESRSRGTVYLLFFRGGLFTMIARLCQLFEFYCASRLAWLVNCCKCFFLSFLFFFQYNFSLSCACVHWQQQRLYDFFFPSVHSKLWVTLYLSNFRGYLSFMSRNVQITNEVLLLCEKLCWKMNYIGKELIELLHTTGITPDIHFFPRRQAYVNIPATIWITIVTWTKRVNATDST